MDFIDLICEYPGSIHHMDGKGTRHVFYFQRCYSNDDFRLFCDESEATEFTAQQRRRDAIFVCFVWCGVGKATESQNY